jgi:hypothetical protein
MAWLKYAVVNDVDAHMVLDKLLKEHHSLLKMQDWTHLNIMFKALPHDTVDKALMQRTEELTKTIFEKN